MLLKRSFAIAAIGLIVLALAAAPVAAHAADSNQDGRFWTELPPDSGHVVKTATTLPDFVDLSAKLSPAVVNVSSDESKESSPEAGEEHELPGGGPFEEFGPRPRSLGSGFIISKDGFVLTNDHVVENPGKITVTTQDGHVYTAKLIGHDEKTDVALLKIVPRHDLPVAPLGNSDDVKVGEWVMAIGNPFGFDHSVTVGIVSAKGRFIPGNFDDFIQTDASINPGNSGGPLINARGEVIAVNSAIYTRTGASAGIGFAIPINMVKEELPQLKTSGKVVRGWLGVKIQGVTPDIADSMGLGDAHGALVAEVLKGGPAQVAGVKRGDVIVAYDNQPVTDSRELPLLVGRSPLGHVATVRVIRDKQPVDLKITITQSRESELAAAEKNPQAEGGTASPFGLYVKDLSADLARELGLDEKNGVVISSVQPGSRADEAGLRARDVILEVNRAAVKNVAGYQQALAQGGKGKIVLMLVRRGDTTMYFAIRPEA
jgi:serine protease Do